MIVVVVVVVDAAAAAQSGLLKVDKMHLPLEMVSHTSAHRQEFTVTFNLLVFEENDD